MLDNHSLALDAMLFAREIHKDQVRKYTGNPYVDHLAEVAGIVATVLPHFPQIVHDTMIAVAWLHDCIEDQGVTIEDLTKRFGPMVASGVLMLSDLEEGNRAERKAASRERLSHATNWVQTIKCADLISNTSSIVKHDPKFAVVYLQEKRELLATMNDANPHLWHLANMMAGAA